MQLDPNPQFAELAFGRVQEISFKAVDGHVVKGGMYLPPNYAAGTKYPVVIQTHAWNPQRFWIDGPFATGFAAQPLAGKGFVVVQLEEDLSRQGTLIEVREEASAYDGVIDYLADKGLIDRNRVGVIGFSRSGLGVKYALIHSKHAFAAATVADGSDVGYFRYLAYLNSKPWQVADAEGINGGVPFGMKGLPSWVQTSLGFGLEKISTPVRLEANGPGSLFFSWEWFTGLSRLGRPVDLIYMPDATHVLVKPWNRITSQQGNVDWFCFWLKGEEDSDPAKLDQYTRWRELRKLQNENQKPSDASLK